MYNFFFVFSINWIDPELVHHSFSLILLVNACVFHVSFENKVNLVLADVPSNFSISHIFESFSLIPHNRRVDNFIKYVVVFANKFFFNRGVIIIMHVDDPQVLKEICSFLKSYLLKVHMKWIVVN